MKAIKIILAVVVVGVLGYFAWKWLIKPIDPPEQPTPPRNQFIERIEKEIDSLGKMSTNSFCPELNQKIQYDIKEFYTKGYLGETTSDNDQWNEILNKNLYSTYAQKFVKQAMTVFGGNEWEEDKLVFIRNEAKELQKSDYLKSNSPVKASFAEIETILAKYDEIEKFLNNYDKFNTPNNNVLDKFPSNKANEKIQKAKNYLKNNLDNSYVNNCTRLKDGLKEVPRKLFDKHEAYLKQKINSYASKYWDYETQAEYSTNVYTPLLNQINEIDYKVYGLGESFVEGKKDELFDLLTNHNKNAYNYFISLNAEHN